MARTGSGHQCQKTILKKAFPQYLRAINLDTEVIVSHIEVLRFKTLLQLSAGKLDLRVENLIAQIEDDKLQLMEKLIYPGFY